MVAEHIHRALLERGDWCFHRVSPRDLRAALDEAVRLGRRFQGAA
ncbi:hypothetical protein [Saccharothrix sp. S26]|nr:hypothetical protein [Saccharothrix sp. S26]